MHGGEVEASSEGVGRGSEFRVRLPLARRGVVADESGDRHGSPGRRCRVLVVDDSRDAATSLARLLVRHWNQEVRTAHDGHEALELAREFGPEMILLDIGLPGLDGYEVARRLRQREAHGETLLVALTGYGQDEDRRKSQEAGFDMHLVKPVEPGVIRRIFEHPALARCQPE
jgi:CheY-like chemotaxis protein